MKLMVQAAPPENSKYIPLAGSAAESGFKAITTLQPGAIQGIGAFKRRRWVVQIFMTAPTIPRPRTLTGSDHPQGPRMVTRVKGMQLPANIR